VTETEALSRVDLARYDPGWADRFAENAHACSPWQVRKFSNWVGRHSAHVRLAVFGGIEAESRRYFARR
jgi:hypothetical protein